MSKTILISFVIIGRNEEKHLADCIQSAMQAWPIASQREIIYVDNNSTDRSLAIARQFPVKIIALKRNPPTPGRGRNAGLKSASGEFIQFIDGDMKLSRDWIFAALPHFEDAKLAAIVGRLQEIHPNKSLYNRVIDLGWKLAEIGEINSPGGGGLFRTEVLRQVGGYEESLYASEEIDLGYRLRRSGYRIVRLPVLMAEHDLAMQSFRQFLRRGARDGFGEMAMIARYFNWSWPLPQSYVLKMNLQLLAFLALLVTLIIHPAPILAGLTLALPALFVLKKARYFNKATHARSICLVAALFNYLNMIPVTWGQLRFVMDRLFNRTRTKGRSEIPQKEISRQIAAA